MKNQVSEVVIVVVVALIAVKALQFLAHHPWLIVLVGAVVVVLVMLPAKKRTNRDYVKSFVDAQNKSFDEFMNSRK